MLDSVKPEKFKVQKTAFYKLIYKTEMEQWEHLNESSIKPQANIDDNIFMIMEDLLTFLQRRIWILR